MLNDPILLKLTEDRFWLSIADSDVLLWTKGLALGYGMDVQVGEPDVSPLAVQGPKADALLEKVFGSSVRSIRFFRFGVVDFNGHPLGSPARATASRVALNLPRSKLTGSATVGCALGCRTGVQRRSGLPQPHRAR